MNDVVDRALQVHGGLGVTDDTVIAWYYRHERAARIYDGPDEVHKNPKRQCNSIADWDIAHCCNSLHFVPTAAIMNKLRVSVILPDNMVPTWIRHMLEEIKNSPHAEVTALAFADQTGNTAAPANKQYELQFNLDKKLFRPEPDPWELNDIRKTLYNTQILGVNLHERLSRLSPCASIFCSA